MEKYKKVYDILNDNKVQNHIKQTRYFRELNYTISNSLKKICTNQKVDKTICELQSIVDFIDMYNLKYYIQKDLPDYSRLINSLFEPYNKKLDIGIIMANANALDRDYPNIFKNVVMSIHHYIMSDIYIKYENVIKQLYRLSLNYNQSLKKINLNDYKDYAYQLNSKYFETTNNSDYGIIINKKNVINDYVINNSDKELYKKLFDLLQNTKSITVTSLLATKIEKDLICLRLNNSINALKKEKAELTEAQINYIYSIINIKVDNIDSVNEDILKKIRNYIKSDNTTIDNALKLKKILIDRPKSGGSEVILSIINILIILILILLIAFLLIGLIYTTTEFYKYLTKNNNCNCLQTNHV